MLKRLRIAAAAAILVHIVKALLIEAMSDAMYRFAIERAHDAIVLAIFQ